MIQISLEQNAPPDTRREWLETDGRGGYASSTLAGCHTRKYHGLMVVNLPKPEGLHVLLSKLEDSLCLGREEIFFTAHRYPGQLFPPGPFPLGEFILDTAPRFVYRKETFRLIKEVMLLPAGDHLLLRYTLVQAPAGGLLRLKPFLAFRGYHTLARENPYLRDRTEAIENGFGISPYEGMPPLFIRTSAPSSFHPSPMWYRRFEYPLERERGFAWQEDLFLPGVIELALAEGEAVILSVSCNRTDEDPAAAWARESSRRRNERMQDEGIADGFPAEDRELLLALIRAGRQFLITTPSGRPAVIAGYPWFGSWGRDTLISLPGLAFCSGRIQQGIEILTEIGRHEWEGLLPNFFSADGRPEAYNTIDSSLLYFRVVQELFAITGDEELIRSRFWPVMKRIVECFRRGTRFETGMDDRGLLHAGDGRTALTWMDAAVDGRPVTPRSGCAVEINALWYNALCFTRQMAERFGEEEGSLADLIPRLRRSFQETFWNPAGNCLGDVFRDGVLDTALRPNQLFAVSLPFSPLDPPRQRAVVETVREHLLTPFGLRTLSPTDPAYRGRYRGDGAERDAAYHQGTVWPWLLGPFGEAALHAAADTEREKEFLRGHLRVFLKRHLAQAGVGSVSEVFDGDPPHQPGGCPAQAWSVAELIRLFFLLKG